MSGELVKYKRTVIIDRELVPLGSNNPVKVVFVSANAIKVEEVTYSADSLREMLADHAATFAPQVRGSEEEPALKVRQPR